MGGNSSNSNSMDDWARDFTASYQRGSQGTSKQREEDSYGFEDFFKDLDKEIVSWAKERGGKGGSKASRSLWEELEAIGEELVEFIEETIVGTEDSKSEESDRGLGWTEGPSSPPPPPPPPTRPQSTNKSASPPSTTIDDELAALKKKMGKL